MKRFLIIFMTALSVLMMTSCGEVEETFSESVSIAFEAETGGFGRVEGEVNQTASYKRRGERTGNGSA